MPMETPSTLLLIPTRFKSKIAHTHSYPIGAEAISQALAGVPQFDLLELTFWDYKFQPLATSYTVLEINYRKPGNFHSASKDMIERGYFEAKWAVTVKPVPRVQRHAIQTELLERGLPFVKQWLMKNASSGRNRTAKMTHFWYEEEQRLGYEVEQRVQPERF